MTLLLRRPRRHRTRTRTAGVLVAAACVVAACSNSTPPQAVRAGAGGQVTQQTLASGATVTTAGPGDTTAPTGQPGAGVGGPGRSSGPATPQGDAGAGPATGSGGGGGDLAPSSALGSRVGVTDSTIRIAVSGPFSGIYAPVADKLYDNGIALWQDEVNRAGGIHGRKLELVKVDNQFTADGAIAACKTIKSNGAFMVMNVLGVTAETDCEDAAGIPVFDMGPSYLRPWRYALPGFFLGEVAPTDVSFLRSPMMNAASKKIGIVYLGDFPQAVAGYEAMVRELERQGMNLVHTEKVATNQTSFVSEASRMRAAGVEVAVLYVALEGAGILRDSRAIGYNPQWYSPPLGASTDIASKAGNEQLRGIRGTRRFTTTETPQFAAYIAKVRERRGEAAARGADTTDMLAFGLSDVVGEMLRMTGPDLTRESFVAAARSIENYDRLGLIGPFTLKGRPVGQLSMHPVECCNPDYTFKSLGPPREQF